MRWKLSLAIGIRLHRMLSFISISFFNFVQLHCYRSGALVKEVRKLGNGRERVKSCFVSNWSERLAIDWFCLFILVSEQHRRLSLRYCFCFSTKDNLSTILWTVIIRQIKLMLLFCFCFWFNFQHWRWFYVTLLSEH